MGRVMMRSIESLLGMPILSADEGSRLGSLGGVEISPEEQRIIYLCVDPSGKFRRGVIAWSDLTQVGTDALLVRSASVLRPEVAPIDRERLVSRLGDRPVLTEGGRRVGHISDYDVDEATGRIVRYHIPVGGLLAHLRHQTISFGPEAIRTFGKDAILVAEDAFPDEEEVDQTKAAQAR